MALIIQKFGGTSLADPASRELLASKAASALAEGDRIVIVVSAMGRRGDPYATDTLLDLLGQYQGGADGLCKDLMASCGEVISACLISALLNARGIPAQPMTASSAGILASGEYLDADPCDFDPARVGAVLERGIVPVVTGFQGMDASGRILTLGRGGSDTTAVLLAAGLGADFVDIYKDVPGVAKADPRLVPAAPYVDFLDYDSMFRLARHGARVLHDKSAVLAKTEAVRMRVRSTFGSGKGTLIGPAEEGSSAPDFIGLSTSSDSEGRSRLTAVFALGKAGLYRRRAAEFAAGAGLEPLESGDPDAISYGCPGSSLKDTASALFSVLEG